MSHLSKVLIVEDDTVTAKYMNHLIQKLGYAVVGVVASGEDAIIQSLSYDPDLILMDINLQGELNGIDAANEIKKKQTVPIIYLTALSDNETLKQAQKSGPFGYVVKPFVERELEVIMAAALYKDNQEQSIKDIQERHLLSLKNFRGISFRSDMDFMPLFINGPVQEIIGCSEDEFMNKRLNWDHFVHPEDESFITQDLKSKFQDIPNFQINKEFRIINESGGTKWIRHFMKNVCDKQGKPQNIVGTICDITEYKEVYESLNKLILNFDNLKKNSIRSAEYINSLKREVNELRLELGRDTKYDIL